MKHMKKDRGAVLVTGTSSGLGRACALKLDQAGYQVFAGVRSESDAEGLTHLASSRLIPVVLDITDEVSIAAAASKVAEEVCEVGLVGLVNNAGIAVPAPLEVIPLAELRRQFEVNVIGQVVLTQALLPLIRKARGRILNVGSVASSMAFPFAGATSASKAAFESINDALATSARCASRGNSCFARSKKPFTAQCYPSCYEVQRKSGLIGKEGVLVHSFPYGLLFPKMSTGPNEKKGLKTSLGDEFFR